MLSQVGSLRKRPLSVETLDSSEIDRIKYCYSSFKLLHMYSLFVVLTVPPAHANATSGTCADCGATTFFLKDIQFLVVGLLAGLPSIGCSHNCVILLYRLYRYLLTQHPN